MFNIERLRMRIALCLLGTILCGIAVGFFKFAAFGVDPFTSLVSGLDMISPIEYGMLYIVINAVLLLVSLIFDRHMIGLGTIANLFLVGYLAQYSQQFLTSVLPAESLIARIVCLLLGIVGLCFSCGLYMPANMGVSTYDAIAIIMEKKWHIGKFKYNRIATDFVCVIIGTILYVMSGEPIRSVTAIVGIGTIITAFFMGPLVDFFANNFTKKFFLKD
ncbi:MAG: hypothetical protein IJR15_00055 [Clostridiales bacterium]|nr:hypothetical protein [Clostridiales bacterium]